MTSDVPNNDDWLSNPAPPPRAVGAPTHQTAASGARQRLHLASGAKSKGKFAGLAEQLQSAPVVAEPLPKGAGDAPPSVPPHVDPGPSPDPIPDPKGGSAPPPYGGTGRPKGEIWEGCPVKPLGVNGDTSWYLDRHGQLRGVQKLEALKIAHIFGEKHGPLCWHFPIYGKDGERKTDRFDAQRAAMSMIAAASEKGLFNPDGAVRGPGAWADDAGGLIYHCGQKLITAEGPRDPGEIGGHIYPAYPPIPAPAPTGARGDPSDELMGTLSSWNWTRPDVDPMLGLGMIATMMLCGALAWRPVYWITGDAAAGKSAFQDLLKYILGERGMVATADATKSGITSALGHSSLPVAIDELEPGKEGSSKEEDLIKLARVAASGSQWRRGSADQKGTGGNVYSSFLFSSILIPGSMGAQDRSRLITLSLNPIPADATRPVITARHWGPRGAALKRALIDRWGSWAERLDLWRMALAEVGLSGRNGDNWATTIAMADMAMTADLPRPEYLAQWSRKLAFAAKAETDEVGSNAEDMLMHLLGQPFDVYRRGELWSVAQWLMVAAQLPGAPRELVVGSDPGSDFIDANVRRDAGKRANEKLAKIGLRVKGEGHEAEVFIPNQPIPGLCKLFERSQWANGVWSQAAKRVPGATAVAQPLSFAAVGKNLRGVYIPFKSIGALAAFPMDRAPAPASTVARSDVEDFI